MTTPRDRIEPLMWRPQRRFSVSILSQKQISTFNDAGGIAVYLDTKRSVVPDIQLSGSQSESFAFWDTRSASGFFTKPKFSAELITIRFVTSGHILYRRPGREIVGSPTHATLTGFDDINEVKASNAVGTLSATFSVQSLIAANEALTGGDRSGLPPFAPLADMSAPGLRALFCSLRQVQRRIGDVDSPDDLIFPLVQEVLGYQLLSFWPRQIEIEASIPHDVSSAGLRRAVEYIHANLRRQIRLSDISAAAGLSIRSLQDKFRTHVAKSPVEYIIDRRLAGAHRDLIAATNASLSIQEIARRWGFVHISDFGQRYRRLYGCTPSRTRRDAERDRRS